MTFEPSHEKTELFANAKTKAQISCAVTAQLISAFVFATMLVQSLLNPKFSSPWPSSQITQPSLCRTWVESTGNPEDQFSNNEAHLIEHKAQLYTIMRKNEIRPAL